MVIDNSSVMFALSKVASYIQELQKCYKEEKEMEKLTKRKRNKVEVQVELELVPSGSSLHSY